MAEKRPCCVGCRRDCRAYSCSNADLPARLRLDVSIGLLTFFRVARRHRVGSASAVGSGDVVSTALIVASCRP